MEIMIEIFNQKQPRREKSIHFVGGMLDAPYLNDIKNGDSSGLRSSNSHPESMDKANMFVYKCLNREIFSVQ